MSVGGCIVIYNKLPRRIRKFITKHTLLTDVLALIGIYMILGGTLTALLAASICGLMVSALLYINQNKNDYLFLYDLRDSLKEKASFIKQKIQEYNNKHKSKTPPKTRETMYNLA